MIQRPSFCPFYIGFLLLLHSLSWTETLGLNLQNSPMSSRNMPPFSIDHDMFITPIAATRRLFLASSLLPILLRSIEKAEALDMIRPESSNLPMGLLESRVNENVLSPPPYGMEASDVTYPSWFRGTWRVKSTVSNIKAPCGVLLFGGNATYQSALNEIGTTLTYESRFIPMGDEANIADRAFNVASIAKAAMGPNSVVDITMASPNKFSSLLAPNGAPSLLKVDLLTLNRRQENISETQFHCSEVVREIVAPSSGVRATPSLLKEIETISLYTYDPAKDTMTCRQRSAAFLLPSQQDLVALKLWQASQGRPVDVRFYDVEYTHR